MATIITKNSQTASAVPSAASLAVGELAVNTADGKLYTEHTGGVVKEIIPSTVVDGGITTAKIADGAITTAKIAAGAVVEADIADGAVTTNKLSSTGVTAGTYTTATVTVDAKGRITSASSGSGGGVTSLNGQTGAITNTNIDAIGSYVTACTTNSAGSDLSVHINQNSTIAGSSLRWGYTVANGGGGAGGLAYTPSNSGGSYNAGGNALSGTWRCVGRNAASVGQSGAYQTSYYWVPGLFVRIS
jgi:hypothetical protein